MGRGGEGKGGKDSRRVFTPKALCETMWQHRMDKCGLGTHADLSIIRLSSHMEAHDTDTCRALTHTRLAAVKGYRNST